VSGPYAGPCPAADESAPGLRRSRCGPPRSAAARPVTRWPRSPRWSGIGRAEVPSARS